ncbi:MAG: glycosyltransferase family 4 protein [Bacteroidota bacterium]
MNILYLCDEYPPGRHGGIGTAVQILARQMVKMGHSVVVAGLYGWGYGGADRFTDEGVKVYRFRRAYDSSLFRVRNPLYTRVLYKLCTVTGIFQRSIEKSLRQYHVDLEQLISEFAIDIVEMPDFNDYVQYCNRYTAFPKLSKPVIVKLHSSLTFLRKERGLLVPAHMQAMEKDILGSAAAVCSVSKYTAQKTKVYFDHQKPIRTIYNGIVIGPDGQDAAKNINQVVYTGALVSFKGIYQLMKAWNIVHARMQGVTLQVYGKGDVARARAELNKEAAGTVIFNGHIPREALMLALRSASIAVFPSYIESFAFGPMEAMENNTTVIYTKRVSGPELIEDGINGILIDPDNYEDIADKIIYLLRHKSENDVMAGKGRTTIKQRFDIEVIAAQNLAFYAEVLAGSEL